jgi:hypothetical protein
VSNAASNLQAGPERKRPKLVRSQTGLNEKMVILAAEKERIDVST